MYRISNSFSQGERTLKNTLRQVGRVHCPIEPETLLAQIQGELPVDELRDVQRHIQTCERCSLRMAQLREAYDQVAVLADVPDVPPASIREAVMRESQGHMRAVRLTHGLNFSVRAVLLSVVGLFALVILIIVAVAGPLLRSRILAVPRSSNTLSGLAPVGAGLFYAETVKLIPITVNGTEWDVGEIVAVSEHTGQVVKSLPASSRSPFFPALGIGSGANIRPALSANGQTLVEAAIAGDGHTPSAIAAIDTSSGQVRYIAQLAVPAGIDAQAMPVIHDMWITPDNQTVIVLTNLSIGGHLVPRLLQFDLATGKQRSGFVPPADTDSAQPTLGDGPTVLSPDGTELYNVMPSTNAAGQAGITLTFLNIPASRVDATLFFPGDFSDDALAVSLDGSQLFFVNGATTTIYFISTKARAVLYTLPLAGSSPGAAQGTAIAGNGGDYGAISLAVTPNTGCLFISLDKRSANNQSYNLWSVSIDQESFLSVTQFDLPVGQIASSSDGSGVLILRPDGTVQSIAAVHPALPTPWLVLDHGARVIQLIGGAALPARPAPTAVPSLSPPSTPTSS